MKVLTKNIQTMSPGRLLATIVTLSFLLSLARSPAQAQVGPGLLFVENVGQFQTEVRFQAHLPHGTLNLTETNIWFTFFQTVPPDPYATTPAENLSHQAVSFRLSFVDAAPAAIEPFTPAEAHVSYLTGNGAFSDVPTWAGLRYADLYPNLDVEVTGDNGQLTLRLVVKNDRDRQAVETSLREVQLRVEGADSVEVTGDGLRLNSAAGEFLLPLLTVVDAGGHPLDVAPEPPAVHGNTIDTPFASGTVSAAATVSAQAIVTSPKLPYSTYLGGEGALDTGTAIAIDNAGHAYVTGLAYPGFPTTPGAFDPTVEGVYTEAFVAKLSADGSSLEYATFLGGSDYDVGQAIKVDSAGAAYVIGYTSSDDFPVTPGAFDTDLGDGSDAFVAKLSPAGDALEYATYLGGKDIDFGWDLTIDDSGHAYATGYTQSTDFPTSPGAFQTAMHGGDTYATKLTPDGSDIVFSTLVGGDYGDYGYGIEADAAGNVYLTGYTSSLNFPTTPGAISGELAGEVDVFVTKLSADGTSQIYGTLLSGSQYDDAQGIAVDSAGFATITGFTESDDFPTTPNAFDPTCEDCDGIYLHIDAFVSRLNPTGTGLVYSSYLGGNNVDFGYDLTLTPDGSTLVSGYTSSANFPTTGNAFATTCPACTSGMAYTDAFLSRVHPSGGWLTYSTFLGGADGSDRAYGVVTDNDYNAYLTGFTNAQEFPVTPGAYQTTLNSYSDVFISKLALGPPELSLPSQSCAPTALGSVVVGHQPRGVVIDPERQRLYVANFGSNSVSVIDTRTNTLLTEISDIPTANGIAFNPVENQIWVSNFATDQVTLIQADDSATNFSVTMTVDVGDEPWGVAYNPGDHTINVANSGDDTVSIIGELDFSPGNPRVVSIVSDGISEPYHLVANSKTGQLYVANHGNNSVAIIFEGRLQQSVPLYDSSGAYGIAIDETRDLIYVSTIDTNRIVALHASGFYYGWAAFYRGFGDRNRPVPLRAIAVNPAVAGMDGGHLWATTSTGDGSQFDQALLIPKGWPGGFHIPIASDVPPSPGEGIAIDPTTNRVYITSGESPGLVTIMGDHNNLCPDWFAHTANAGEDAQFDFELYSVEKPSPADVTGDGVINIQDLAFVASHYGTKFAAADVTGDGAVDIFDLVAVASRFTQ